MTERDEPNALGADEARFLDRARQGLGPSAADRARIAHALAAQLAMPSMPPALPERFKGGALRTAHWIGLGSLVAVAGALGYWQGYRAGSQHREVVTVVRSVPVAMPAAANAEPFVEPQPLPAQSEDHAPLAALGAGHAAPGASGRATAKDATRPAATLGLDEEVRQLRRVERAIRENNPRLALVLLDELDSAIPTGQLLEERKAASVMANCQLAAPSAHDEARAFAAAHAQSAYVSRVRQICQLATEIDERIVPTPGTNVPR